MLQKGNFWALKACNAEDLSYKLKNLLFWANFCKKNFRKKSSFRKLWNAIPYRFLLKLFILVDGYCGNFIRIVPTETADTTDCSINISLLGLIDCISDYYLWSAIRFLLKLYNPHFLPGLWKLDTLSLSFKKSWIVSDFVLSTLFLTLISIRKFY